VTQLLRITTLRNISNAVASILQAASVQLVDAAVNIQSKAKTGSGSGASRGIG